MSGREMNMWDWLDLLSYRAAEGRYQELLYEDGKDSHGHR